MYSASKRSIYTEAGSPSLWDIAQGLSRIVRFAGQTKKFYPVLAHTFTVANLVAPEYRLHALLHDAPEAVVSDVPSSWKTSHHSLNESILLDRIYYELGVPSIKKDFKAQAAVKRADRIALSAEALRCGHSEPDHNDFHTASTPEEIRIAIESTQRHIDAGSLAWIDLEFAQGYVDLVEEEVRQYA